MIKGCSTRQSFFLFCFVLKKIEYIKVANLRKIQVKDS